MKKIILGILISALVGGFYVSSVEASFKNFYFHSDHDGVTPLAGASWLREAGPHQAQNLAADAPNLRTEGVNGKVFRWKPQGVSDALAGTGQTETDYNLTDLPDDEFTASLAPTDFPRNGWGWWSDQPYTGTFDAGNWTFNHHFTDNRAVIDSDHQIRVWAIPRNNATTSARFLWGINDSADVWLGAESTVSTATSVPSVILTDEYLLAEIYDEVVAQNGERLNTTHMEGSANTEANRTKVSTPFFIPGLVQESYRFFNNADSADVGTALAATDVAATIEAATPFRLRTSLHATSSALLVGTTTLLKLQFATKSGTCDTGFVGETYADVTGATTIQFNNNATPLDGATATANAGDPNTHAKTMQRYEEVNPTDNVAVMATSTDGIWDFSLTSTAGTNATFCFRVIKDAGTNLPTYLQVPEIAITTPQDITVAGNAYADEGSADLTACDGVTKNIAVIVGTSTPGAPSPSGKFDTTCADVGNAWTATLTGTTALTAGTPLIAYLNTAGGVVGSALTQYSGTGNVAGLTISQNRLLIKNEATASSTNIHVLNKWDNDQDTDLNYVLDATDNLTLESGSKLIIGGDDTTNASSTITTTAGGASPGGDVEIKSGATLSMGTSALSIGGDLMNFGTLFVLSGQTTTFNGSRVGGNGFNPGAGFTWQGLTIGGSVAITASSSVNIAGTLTTNVSAELAIPLGKNATSTSAGTVTNSGTISGAGALGVQNSNLGTGGTLSSIVIFNTSITMPARTYGGDVRILCTGVPGACTVTMGAGTHTLSGALNLFANGTTGNLTFNGVTNNPTVNITGDLDFTGTGGGSEIINAGTGLWTVSGNADFTGGTFTPSTAGTLTMNGTTKTLTSAANELQNLTLSGTITTADAVSATGTMILSGTTISLGGAASTTGAATLSGGRIYPQTQPIILNGASQTLTGGSGQVGSIRVNGSYTLSGNDLVVGTTTVASGGTLTVGAARTYVSTSTLTLAGTVGGAGTTTLQHSNLGIAGTFNANAAFGTTTATISTPGRIFGSNFEVLTGTTITASAATTTIQGNYLQNGTFTANSGDVLLNGTSQQTLSGTMSGSSAFFRLFLTNTSGTDATTSPSVIFLSVASTTSTFVASSSPTAGVKIRFPSGLTSTSTFQNVHLDGGEAGTRIMLRSSTSGTRFGFAVPGTRQKVRFVDFMDTNACDGSANIDASGGTNQNSGNNGCIDFVVTAATISSAANQTFEVGQAATANSQITVTGGNGSGAITAANDLRIPIATSTVNMRWLTTDTTATFGGTGSGNVANPVSYEGGDGNSVLVIPVNTTFTSGQTLTVSDLSFTSFNTANAAAAGLQVFLDGPTDITANATDDKTIAIKGTHVLAEHTAGQEKNVIGENTTSLTNAEVLAFRLTPTGESVNVTRLEVELSDRVGFVCSDLTNISIFADFNSNGTVDALDTAVGGTPSCAINTTLATGTLAFSTAFATSTARDYILRSDISNIDPGDKLTFGTRTSRITSAGVTSSQTITPTGSVTSVTHVRPSTTIGGGAGTGGGSPAETPSAGGTGTGGGGGTGGAPPPEPPTGGGGGAGGGGETFLPLRRMLGAIIFGLERLIALLLQ